MLRQNDSETINQFSHAKENEIIDEIVKLSVELLEKKPNHTQRQQHPKSHGCVKAEFIIGEVPEYLRHGIFRQPGSYPTWIRFSNGSTNVQPDAKGDARGMAIKLMGVEGEKILESEKHAETQDFILINHPVLFLKDAQDALEFSQAVRLVSKMPPLPLLKLLAFLFMYMKSHPKQADILKSIRKKSVVDLFQERYWSTTPYKLGPHTIKFATQPHLGDHPQSVPPQPTQQSENFLREAMVDHLRVQDVYFDFLVQLQTDAAKMPIEDATTRWSEADSPFIKVATLKIPQQEFDTIERRKLDENLSYNPWHSLPEHQPLGSVNRARRSVYEAISKVRHEWNQQPTNEPTAAEFYQQP